MNNENEVSIKEIIDKIRSVVLFLRKKWFVFFLTCIMTGLTGILYSIWKKPAYVATISFALEEDKSGGGVMGGALGLASQFGIDLGSGVSDAFSGANLSELIKSRSLIEKTLLVPVIINGSKTTLAEFYLDFNKINEDWETNENLKSVKYLSGQERNTFTRAQDSVLGKIYEDISKGLTVGPKDKKVSIINATIASGNELFSYNFIKLLISTVSDFYVTNKSAKSRANVTILERQVDSVRRELNSAIYGVASDNDNTYNLNPGLNIKRVPSSKKQIDVQANTAILTQLVANLELARVSLRKETPLLQIIDTPIFPLDKIKVSKREALLVGFIIGFFLVITYYAIRKMWNELKSM